jgi:hypothetical protein
MTQGFSRERKIEAMIAYLSLSDGWERLFLFHQRFAYLPQALARLGISLEEWSGGRIRREMLPADMAAGRGEEVEIVRIVEQEAPAPKVERARRRYQLLPRVETHGLGRCWA